MNCFVCSHRMEKYFTKNWEGFPEGEFFRCPNCGITVNKTLYEMDKEDWELFNRECHTYQGADGNTADPRWIERLEAQANVFSELFREGIFEHHARLVDYGCGDAKLSKYFASRINDNNEQIQNYDKFMGLDGYLDDLDMQKGNFDAVITCSVFEHLLGGEDVKEIFSYLSPKGVFCMHTLVCETVPQDSDWFYLFPPHCTLWTNKSMQIIFEKYGFLGCGYHTAAKMWFFFRNEQQFNKLKEQAENFTGKWVFSADFVDYWK